MIDCINLSNGLSHLKEPNHFAKTEGIIYSRVQSTALEQKRWETVLHGFGPDVLYRLAKGESIMFHDESERNRLTRACWQGIPFLRFVIYQTWVDNPKWMNIKLYQRDGNENGINVKDYFLEVYKNLDRNVLKEVLYFKKYMEYAATFKNLPIIGTIVPCKIRVTGVK